MNAKNKIEYSKIYEPLAKDWQNYQRAASFVNRMKAHANSLDYKSIANELENFSNENKNTVVKALDKKISNSNPNPNYYKMLKPYASVVAQMHLSKPFANFVQSGVNKYMNKARPEARQFMDLALFTPNQHYSNNEFTMISHQFNQEFNNFLAKYKPELQFDNNTNGIVFHKNSSISKELSNSSQLQKEVRSVFAKYPKNVILSDSEFALNKDVNLHYAVGHYTIINPKINSEGKFSAYLFDIYDFKYQTLQELDNRIKLFILNNMAYIFQELGYIGNYYVLIPIEFDW